MARKQHNELLAGVFVLLCGAALIGVIVWLSGFRVGGQHLYLTVPLSAGNTNIQTGSEVFVGPTKVGAVRSVHPDGNWQQFCIEVHLEREVDIRRDAIVETSSPPLGGNASITFLTLGGSEERPSRDRPIALRVGPSPLVRDIQRELGYGEAERTAFQAALASLSAAAGNLAQISEALKPQLTAGEEPNMLSHAVETLSDLRLAMGDIRQQMAMLKGQLDPQNPSGVMAKTHRSLDDVNQATAEVAALTTNIRPNVEATARRLDELTQGDLVGILASLRSASNELLAVMGDFHDVSSAARQVVMVNQDNINEMLANLNEVSVNLKAAAREVRMQPWKLMGKPTVEEVRSQNIQEAARAFAEGASELDAAITRLTLLSQTARDPIPADDPQLVNVRQRIRDSLGKFIQAEQALWKEMAQ